LVYLNFLRDFSVDHSSSASEVWAMLSVVALAGAWNES